MKLQLSLILGAACALFSVAHGQSVGGEKPDNSVNLDAQTRADMDKAPSSRVQLRDIPHVGELFRAPSAAPRAPFQTPRYDAKSLFGAQFPPVPWLDPAQAAGTRVLVLKVDGAEALQVEVVRQSIADVLKEITAFMGVRAVIDPQLEQEQLTTRVLRARDWDELLRSFGEAVEVVKSSEGTYFFAARPIRLSSVSYTRMPDGTYQRTEFFSRSRALPWPALDDLLLAEPSKNRHAVPGNVPSLVAPEKTER